MSIYKYNINNNIYLEFILTKRLKCGIILTNQRIFTYSKEVVNIWDEMSYNYYWAYREVDFKDRLNTEPDFQDMEYNYELEDLYISES